MAEESSTTGGKQQEDDDQVTLLGFWSSPFVLRARFALHFKGVPYEYVEEDLFGSKSELLLSSNPVHGKVPVLIHNGRSVSESLVIVEYVDETFPNLSRSLLPSDPRERAAARFWASYVDAKLLPTWIPLYGGRTAEERVEAARQVVAVLETFERRALGETALFFGGESAGLVDVTLGGFLGWLRASEAMCGVKVIDPARTPRLAAWAERFGALDGVREIVPETRRLVEYNLMNRARRGLPFLPPHHQQKSPFTSASCDDCVMCGLVFFSSFLLVERDALCVDL